MSIVTQKSQSPQNLYLIWQHAGESSFLSSQESGDPTFFCPSCSLVAFAVPTTLCLALSALPVFIKSYITIVQELRERSGRCHSLRKSPGKPCQVFRLYQSTTGVKSLVEYQQFQSKMENTSYNKKEEQESLQSLGISFYFWLFILFCLYIGSAQHSQPQWAQQCKLRPASRWATFKGGAKNSLRSGHLCALFWESYDYKSSCSSRKFFNTGAVRPQWGCTVDLLSCGGPTRLTTQVLFTCKVACLWLWDYGTMLMVMGLWDHAGLSEVP